MIPLFILYIFHYLLDIPAFLIFFCTQLTVFCHDGNPGLTTLLISIIFANLLYFSVYFYFLLMFSLDTPTHLFSSYPIFYPPPYTYISIFSTMKWFNPATICLLVLTVTSSSEVMIANHIRFLSKYNWNLNYPDSISIFPLICW